MTIVTKYKNKKSYTGWASNQSELWVVVAFVIWKRVLFCFVVFFFKREQAPPWVRPLMRSAFETCNPTSGFSLKSSYQWSATFLAASLLSFKQATPYPVQQKLSPSQVWITYSRPAPQNFKGVARPVIYFETKSRFRNNSYSKLENFIRLYN